MFLILLLLFIVQSAAQTILDFSLKTPSLSKLASLIGASPQLSSLLLPAYNFTFLAPTDDAISTWLAGNRSQSWIEATLTYHLLSGSHPTALLSTTAQFVPSALSNTSFANVTGGQRIEASRPDETIFQSGNKTSSKLVSGDYLIPGGMVHIIDSVLQIPSDILKTVTDAGLSYAIAIFNREYFWSGYNPSFFNTVTVATDMTWFVPNSAAALDDIINASPATQEQFTALASYHCIVGSVLYSSSFKNGTKLTMFSGLPAIVRILDDGTTYINSAKVIASDYLINNGVMHIIDSNLMPGNTTGPSVTTLPTIIPSSQPTEIANGTIPQAPRELSVAAYTGIGVGAGITLLLIIIGAMLCVRQKRLANQKGQLNRQRHSRIFELSAGVEGIAQLETRERFRELPVGRNNNSRCR
ncbi:FAS1 domain-containing protein [Hyaloscypha sp. PMI_1271]|nr:FAS1 domain-containing protein [Hyaloscypha sp. PMI_1271]